MLICSKPFLSYRFQLLDCEGLSDKGPESKNQQLSFPSLSEPHRCCCLHSQHWPHLILYSGPVLEVCYRCTRVINCLMYNISIPGFYFLRYNVRRKAMDKSYPHIIAEDFPGISTPISAALYKQGGETAWVYVLFYLLFFV